MKNLFPKAMLRNLSSSTSPSSQSHSSQEPLLSPSTPTDSSSPLSSPVKLKPSMSSSNNHPNSIPTHHHPGSTPQPYKGQSPQKKKFSYDPTAMLLPHERRAMQKSGTGGGGAAGAGGTGTDTTGSGAREDQSRVTRQDGEMQRQGSGQRQTDQQPRHQSHPDPHRQPSHHTRQPSDDSQSAHHAMPPPPPYVSIGPSPPTTSPPTAAVHQQQQQLQQPRPNLHQGHQSFASTSRGPWVDPDSEDPLGPGPGPGSLEIDPLSTGVMNMDIDPASHGHAADQAQRHPRTDSHSQTSLLSDEEPSDDQPEESSPATLSDWEIVETLGTGTFGRVLLVRLKPAYRPLPYHPMFPNLSQPSDPSAPSPQETAYADNQLPHFAMKVLKKSEIVRLKQVEHINSERAILERVRHPFLVELYGTYQDHLNVYMLLSYVPGGELFSHLRRAGRFTADVTRFYLASIILAIDYLHARDIIYRDLKPENLLLDRSGYLRIADFGFAKIVEDRTFTLCGTPEYLAPEIVLSKGHGKAVDWWALGILCFEMLCGYPPFFDDHPLGIYEKILANKVAFPGHVDPFAKDLIRRLLTADRSKRLGNLRGGAKDVMSHRWFTGVDWATLERREIGAPIVPHVASMGDSQNFQRYPPPLPQELPGILGIPQGNTSDPYKGLFTEFVFPPLP